MFATARRFLGYVIPGIIRPVQILWNQVIGFLFLVLALVPVPSAIRGWGKDGNGARLVLTIPFVLLMGWFGVSSFLKARKISRS